MWIEDSWNNMGERAACVFASVAVFLIRRPWWIREDLREIK
jgi:hypothetical protein